jgi:hypothetical protein
MPARSSASMRIDASTLKPGSVEQLGDAEVEQLHLPVGGDQDVGRLQVAVHDEMSVRVDHRIADGAEELEAALHIKSASIAVAVDGIAFDQLHREVRKPGIGEPAWQRSVVHVRRHEIHFDVNAQSIDRARARVAQASCSGWATSDSIGDPTMWCGARAPSMAQRVGGRSRV